MTAAVYISDVEYELPGQHLYGAQVDLPAAGGSSDTYGFDIRGWILGKSARVMAVDALFEGQQIASVQVTGQRSDVAAAHPDVPQGATSGFAGSIGALRLKPAFEVVLRARFDNDGRLPFARLRGTRHRLPPSEGAALQPVMLTYTIGRTGSTWLAWLLGCHPQIVAYSPFAHDARVATYWIQVLQHLSQPESYRQQLDPDNLARTHWWLTRVRPPPKDSSVEPPIEVSIGRRAIEAAATFCEAQISAFYTDVEGGERRPRYFVEKVLPYQSVPDVLGEVYAGAKEVILVRDFRDVLSSIVAFNRKRGYEAFGRETVGSDAEYVTQRMVPEATALLERFRERGANAHLVRYEDLILKPTRTLARLLRYVGVESGDAIVRATLDRALSGTAHMNQHRTTGDQAASIGRWRSDLPPALADLAQQALGPILAEFGYDLSVDPAARSA